MQKLVANPLGLRSLVSRVSQVGEVSLESEVITHTRDNAAIEAFMGQLSREVGVMGTSWRITEHRYG